MRFNLKPAVRQLSLAFPALLIGLPLAMNAAEEKPGEALPPPSLFDVSPPKPKRATPPTVPAGAAAPSATKPKTVAAKPAAQPAVEQPAQPSESWWRRLFSRSRLFRRCRRICCAPATMPSPGWCASFTPATIRCSAM